MVTSGEIIAQYHSEDVDIDTVEKTQIISNHRILHDALL